MAFIDGQSIYSAAKGIDLEIDYKRLLAYMVPDGDFLVRANYYAAIPPEEEFSPLRPMIDWLSYNGYNVVVKPLKVFTKEGGETKYKSSVIAEMAVDIIEASRRVDHILIFSGDGDLRYVVDHVQRHSAAQVTVFSTIMTSQPMIADELRRQADRFIDLGQIKQEISRERKKIVEEEIENLEVELEKEE